VGLPSGNRNEVSDSFIPFAILYTAAVFCKGYPDNWLMPALAVDLGCTGVVLSVKLDFGEIASNNSSRKRTHRLRRLINGRGISAKGVGQDAFMASITVSTSSSESITSASGTGVDDDAPVKTFFCIRNLLVVAFAFCNSGELEES
jgi:hypothetical protein